MTRAQRWTLLAAIVASGIVFLDSTVVNLALKRIGQELPTTTSLGVLEAQAYVGSGYLAVLAALLIVAGALADRYGRRRIFIIGLASFGTISVFCGLAPTIEILIVARLLQGAAGALLVPGSLAIITAAFDGAARARAFGLWAASTSALTLLGPILGGLLVDNISWRVAFLINVPLVAIALWSAIRHVVESRDPDNDGHFDWLGSVVGAVAVGGLAFGAIRGQESQWADNRAWLALGIGAVSLVLFPILMAVRPRPLVPLSLFRNREFATINLATFLIYGALYVSFTYTALLYQGTLGYSATGAAIIGLPSGILLATLSARVGGLTARFGSRIFLVIGPLIVAAGQLWLARIPATSAPWLADLGRPASLIPPIDALIDVLPSAIAFGAGMAMVVAPLTSTLMSSIPARNSGLGSAINNALSRVGQPLLGAVIFVAITASFYSALAASVPGLDPADPAIRSMIVPLNPPKAGTPAAEVAAAKVASVDAFHLAALVSAGLMVAGSATSWLGLRPATGRAQAMGSGATRSEGPHVDSIATGPG
ncbi:MAG TPA: MFS transporter [Candidatus Limnocylindrales bacterium]|nr:MFS transporter [Candidatus Limnocylindrales bacterium]